MKKLWSLFFCCFYALCTEAQTAAYDDGGFNAKEYSDLMQLNYAYNINAAETDTTRYPSGYELLYKSPSLGLDNAWMLWQRADSSIIIHLRGTTANPLSIAADFYCAMLPATGTVSLPEKGTVTYSLASDPRAAVHAGFLLGYLYLSADMYPKIDSLYRKGFRNIIINGHSQGGALSYYVAAWLTDLKLKKQYPDLRLKTYASAPPKMGNMYFAYDLENKTRANTTYTVINAADIVPEMPLTTQQLESDMNQPNYLLYLYDKMNDLPLVKRIVLKRAFNKMRKSSEKASKQYQKYLDDYSLKYIRSHLEVTVPNRINSTYYNRVGTPVSLITNPAYLAYTNQYPKQGHHAIEAYIFQVKNHYPEYFN